MRRGYAVYVVDQVARGRAANWSQAQGPVQSANLERMTQRFAAPERFKQWPQAHLHTQWPGEGKPGDPAFDQFWASQFPSLASFQRQQEINPPALVALLDKIGPSILLTHSQSGAFIWPVTDARPNLVKANIAVEPNGPPVHELDFKGAPDWFADNPREKAFGLGEVPVVTLHDLSEAQLRMLRLALNRRTPPGTCRRCASRDLSRFRRPCRLRRPAAGQPRKTANLRMEGRVIMWRAELPSRRR